MDISNLLLNRPSLANYMGDAPHNSGPIVDLASLNSYNQSSGLNDTDAQDSAVQLSLSPEAQRILAEQNNTEGSNKKAIKGAQDHFMRFFEENGVDVANLSKKAREFLGGILDVIEASRATHRDTAVNRIQLEKSEGKNQIYTLLGNNRHIRIAIEEQGDGQQKLTLTDILGNQADIAEITLEHGKNQEITINIERQQELFANGRRIATETQEPLRIKT